MDALAALQYLPMLLVAFGALVAAFAIALLLPGKSTPDPQLPQSPPSPSSPPTLPNVMLLFAAVALGFGVLLLLPAMMILQYFPHWQVVSLLIAAAVILLIPFGYLWRARSF